MTTPPTFSVGQYNTAAYMNSIGLWLVKTQTIGSGVASVTVNNCFNADYENYKVIVSGGASSSVSQLSLQLTSGGTASTTGYYGALWYTNLSTAGVGGATDINHTMWNYAGGMAGVSPGETSMNLELLQPFTTKRTRLHNADALYSIVYGSYTGIHVVDSSFDGIKIIASAGTLTGGTIRVYGYRN